MNKNEIISILRLLEDPDPKVYDVVKNTIIDNGELFRIYLENYCSFSSSALGVDRSEAILDELFWLKFEVKLKKYVSNPNSLLSEGVFLLETYFNRDVDEHQIEAYFDTILREVWIEMNNQLTGIEKIKIISKVLFTNNKFKKYPLGEFNPDYLSITNCLSYKKFVAPTISLLYCMIAQQSEIPVFPLEIPGIFLLGYVDEVLADAVFADNGNGIVFYFHPYDEGTLINQQIVEKYIKDNKVKTEVKNIEVLSYQKYLLFIFGLRIMALKQRKISGFCVDYADKVVDLLGKRRRV